MINLQKQCQNFIERAIDNGDIKVVTYDAINEAIHDFCLGNNCLELSSLFERELIPNYGHVINIDDLVYDDDVEALEIGEFVYILENNGDQGLVYSLKTNEKHYIDLDRIEIV